MSLNFHVKRSKSRWRLNIILLKELHLKSISCRGCLKCLASFCITNSRDRCQRRRGVLRAAGCTNHNSIYPRNNIKRDSTIAVFSTPTTLLVYTSASACGLLSISLPRLCSHFCMHVYTHLGVMMRTLM